MNAMLKRAGLTDIAEKVFEEKRISDEDALRLYACRNLNALDLLANHVRERKKWKRGHIYIQLLFCLPPRDWRVRIKQGLLLLQEMSKIPKLGSLESIFIVAVGLLQAVLAARLFGRINGRLL